MECESKSRIICQILDWKCKFHTPETKIWNVQILTPTDLRFQTEMMEIYKQCYLKMQLEFGGVNLSSIYSSKHT